MHFGWAMARATPPTAAHGGNRVYYRQETLPVWHVRPGKHRRKRQSIPINRLVSLRTSSTAVRRRGANRLANRPPFFAPLARTVTESTLARLQSIKCARCNFAKRISCNFCQTPALCQSLKRLQHVMPDPHPISAGSISHGMPLLRTNKMPVRTARSDMGGRPRVPGFA
jgi:hypothetical protein